MCHINLISCFEDFVIIRIYSARAEAGTYMLSESASSTFQANNRLLEFGCANHNTNTILLCLDDQEKPNKVRGRYLYGLSLLN